MRHPLPGTVERSPVSSRELLLAAGPADRALAALASADLPQAARRLAQRLEDTVAEIRARAPGLRVTVDPVEFRGFRYETGVCVTIYAPGRHEELGRGRPVHLRRGGAGDRV